MVPYRRKLADGGIFIATDAKKHGLIDDIGTLDDAAKKAAALSSLSDYHVVQYERPLSFLSLMGLGAHQSNKSEFMRMIAAAGPRLWYLAPQSEFAAMLALMGKE
jgi:ClpP class serine protease